MFRIDLPLFRFILLEAMTAEKKKASQTDTVESYDEAFSRIKRITGTDENDIDRIVNKFIQDEDQNFALFNFVNDQNNKIEILQEQIEQVCQKFVVVSHKKDFHLCNNHPPPIFNLHILYIQY